LIINLKNDKIPYVSVNILGTELVGLLDSGATSTLLGRDSLGLDFINGLGLELRNENINVSTADGTHHVVKGSANVPVPYFYNEKTIIIPTLVVPSLTKRLILGCDFWEKFKITAVVNEISVNLLEEAEKFEKEDQLLHYLSEVQQQQLDRIINIFIPAKEGFLGRTNVITHKIDTGNTKPIRIAAHVWSHHICIPKDINAELQRMISLGVIEPSKSEWAFPMVPVKKANGKIRLCMDSRKLNEITKRDSYPIPHMGRIMKRLETSNYFTA
jgi:hypothetical protein